MIENKDCNHANTKIIKILVDNAYYSWFYTMDIAEVSCSDCPHVQICIRYNSRIFGQGNWSVFNMETCEHRFWKPDTTKSKIMSRYNISGTVLRLVMGPVMDGAQYTNYVSGVGCCDVCQYQFKIEKDYIKKWVNKKQEHIYGDWTIVYDRYGKPEAY